MAQPTVQDLQQQLTDLNTRLKAAGGLGIDLQMAFSNAGNDVQKLNQYVDQLNRQYDYLVNNADYIYRTFQDISAELKNQNLLLKIGRGTFKEFTDIAQNLNYYQKGNNDLTDKQFKKIKNNLNLEKQELEFVVEKLEINKQQRINEVQALNALTNRTSKENARLKELLKENELLINAKETLSSGIPILEKELNLTKQIADTRKDLGGITQAIGKTISQYGGSLASFLNINESIEAVEEFNKKLIQDALLTNEIKNQLLDIEKEKRQIEKDYVNNLLTEEEYLEKIKEQEEKSYQIKQKAIDSTNNLNNKFKSLIVLTKELGIGFKKAITDPIVLITFFVGKAFESNKQTVELGKSLGYAAGRADTYRESIAQIARSSTNIFATTENLVQAFGELVQLTGFAYEFTADQLETQVKLTKQVGLQADEAAQIQRFSVLNGKTSEDTYRSFLRGLTATRNQLRVGINFKAVLAEAAKISGQLAANLGFNPEMIAKAVVTAKAFGMTLEQVANAGDRILDFANSIESELKAELLLGKQINLERARAAALAGDQVTLAEELAKNVGTAAEFTKLNRLQQNALAESVGMTSDALAETLRKREEALASGKSLAQITEEEAAQALERNNIQDKFNQAILKLQDFIGNLVAGPLGSLLDMLTDALSLINLIALPFSAIYELTSMIGNGIGSWLDGLGLAGRIIKGIASAAIIAGAFTAFISLGPILGTIAAAAITSAGFGLLNSRKGDDVLSEGGYGKRTLLAPEGAIKLNDKDTVIAGTNLGVEKEKIINNNVNSNTSYINPSLDTKTEKIENKIIIPQIDLTPMIAAINDVKAAVDKLYSKDTSINMDGKKLGSTLVQGSYKVA